MKEKQDIDYLKILRMAFAKRLTSKLRSSGFVSSRGTNGVNNKKLAEAIGISLPMTRRYLNGQSLPENPTLKKIGDLLDVDPHWLLYGDHHNNGCNIDKELLLIILCNVYPLLGNTEISQQQYLTLMTDCVEIYCNANCMVHGPQQKQQAATLMLDFLKKNRSQQA